MAMLRPYNYSICVVERSALFVLFAEFDISGVFECPVNWPVWHGEPG